MHYRVVLAPEEEITSISPVYSSAFLYENEIRDLFGVVFDNLSVDYQGEFYKLAVRVPYSFDRKPAAGSA